TCFPRIRFPRIWRSRTAHFKQLARNAWKKITRQVISQTVLKIVTQAALKIAQQIVLKILTRIALKIVPHTVLPTVPQIARNAARKVGCRNFIPRRCNAYGGMRFAATKLFWSAERLSLWHKS